ncbi:hypothetical protein RJ55_01866 [Drechmeria coniospora]|nr:hypothetical protein RJ55_01866 [Drechmeria coniospora]
MPSAPPIHHFFPRITAPPYPPPLATSYRDLPKASHPAAIRPSRRAFAMRRERDLLNLTLPNFVARLVFRLGFLSRQHLQGHNRIASSREAHT